MNQEFIYGKNSVYEALKVNPKRINKVLISKSASNDKKISEIIELAKANKIVFSFQPREKFNSFGDVIHQGVAAYVSPVEYLSLEDYFAQEKPGYKKLIALDGVQDPHNLGALIRTCACAGFDGIILAARKGTLVTGIVEKTSAGAINHIPVILVNSLSGAIEKLKKHDYWIIVTDIKAKDNYFDVDYTDMNFVIVLGSEGTGVTKTILNSADFLVKIPILRDFNSLNVSNAAAILIYEVVQQKVQKSKNTV